ncbi:42950_t:CDS:2, partial [Gigaspora margarita]
SYANAAAYVNRTKKGTAGAGWELAFIIIVCGARTYGVSPVTSREFLEKKKKRARKNEATDTQRLWNEQMQKALDERFSKLEQVGLTANEASTNNRRMTDETQNEQATPVTICSQPVMRDKLPQAKTINIHQ